MVSANSLLSSLVVLVAAVSARVLPRQQTPAIMTLRATSLPNNVPSFNSFLDVVGGHAGFNRTAPYTGFSSFIDATSPDGSPIVVGPLYQTAEAEGAADTPGWLIPTSTEDGLYDFNFANAIPDVAGVLSQAFEVKAIECGGQCGGLGIGYAGQEQGQWLAYHDAQTQYGWKLRWISSSASAIPAGHYPAIIWRS